MTTSNFQRPRKFGLMNQLIEFSALTGNSLPRSVNKAIADLATIDSEVLPQAQEAYKAAAASNREAQKSYDRDAVAAVVDAVGNGKAPALLPDYRPEAEKAEREAEAFLRYCRTAANEQFGFLVALAAGDDRVLELVSKVWAETIAWEPKETTKYADIVQHQNNAGAILALCEMIGVQIESWRADAAGDGMSQGERKALKELFDARPMVMPTLDDVRQAARTAQENTPLAKAIRERAESDARKREIHIREAAASAAARMQGENSKE